MTWLGLKLVVELNWVHCRLGGLRLGAGLGDVFGLVMLVTVMLGSVGARAGSTDPTLGSVRVHRRLGSCWLLGLELDSGVVVRELHLVSLVVIFVLGGLGLSVGILVSGVV